MKNTNLEINSLNCFLNKLRRELKLKETIIVSNRFYKDGTLESLDILKKWLNSIYKEYYNKSIDWENTNFKYFIKNNNV